MKKNIHKLKLFPLVFPLVFTMVFFGYFPVHFDMTLYTDNVQGEGICETYVSKMDSFAAFYKIGFYFGSELKKANLVGFQYDVKQIPLTISECTEFDIIGFDTSVCGMPMMHYTSEDLLAEGETVEGNDAILSSNNGVVHVKVKDPNAGVTLTIGVPFISPWFWGSYIVLLVGIALLFTLLFEFIIKKIPGLIMPLVTISTIIVTVLAGCFFCGSLPYATYVNVLLNGLFLISAALFINSISLPFIGTVLVSAFATIWYIVNYFVINLRSKPVMPADIKAIGTAAEVMGGYTFAPTWKMIVGVTVVTIYCTASIVIWKKTRNIENQPLKRMLVKRGISAAVAILLALIGMNTTAFKSLSSFAWDAVLLKSFHEEGMVLTYLKSSVNSGVKKPEGYTREIVEGYLNEYRGKSSESSGTKPTNIIMIMNEAFSDLRTVGLDEKVDVMPFIDSLNDNIVKGSLVVPVFGGGTCNTEFEALTGNTLSFLGTSAYPYTENVTEPMFSVASYFANQGYMAEAFHANEPQNWNRNMVYPNLGFQSFHSINDYKESLGEIPTLHDHPADIADYTYIEKVDGENKDRPRFLFNVTMQNHSGYERWIDVKEADSVKENVSDLYLDSRVYLSLVKASDEDIQQLVEQYQDSDEPTMIIFFGDHQPGLPTVAQCEIYTDVDEYLDLFKSKFFIWTNYESPKFEDVEISANYFPYLIMKQGNFSAPPFVQMLEEVHDKYPIISAMGVVDFEGNVYGSVNELADDPLIQKYQYIQYANMFDEIDSAWFEAD